MHNEFLSIHTRSSRWCEFIALRYFYESLPRKESCPKLVEMESLQVLGYVWKILPKDFLKFTLES